MDYELARTETVFNQVVFHEVGKRAAFNGSIGNITPYHFHMLDIGCPSQDVSN